MPRRALPLLVLVLLLAAIASAAQPARARPADARAQYLALAKDGLGRVRQTWWNPISKWYTTYPWQQKDGAGDLATLWDAVGVFEARALVAVAEPTQANRSALTAFALGAERYWNPAIPPGGAYAYLPDKHHLMGAFFDDNGWWGLAFFDAFRATGNRRFLLDAERAFRFIWVAGWARGHGGGIWWDTSRKRRTSEPLAAEALLGALIYERTHDRSYLRIAQTVIQWADAHSWNAERSLYQRSPTSDTVMDYVEGMMIGAHAVLCRSLHERAYCRRAEQLAAASAVAFPPSYHWAPETDAIYLRWLLELWATDHNRRWYAVADYQARQAVANARDDRGLFSKGWDGAFASPDRLLTEGGTLMLLASLAAVPAPR